MDLLEQMKARRAGVAVPPVAPTSPPPVAPAAGPAPVAMTAAASPALQALTAQANVAPAAPTAPVLSSDQVPAPEGIPAWLTVAPGQINPPETSAPPTALELAASEKAAKPAKASTRAKAAPKVESPAPTQADLDLAQKGSDIAARGMIQMGMPIAFLFVDCAPVRGWNALDGAELATEANRLACKGWEDAGKGKLADYRFGPFELTGMLAKAGESLIRGQAERTGQPVSITLSSQTPEGRILLNPLSALAACVVKGVQS